MGFKRVEEIVFIENVRWIDLIFTNRGQRRSLKYYGQFVRRRYVFKGFGLFSDGFLKGCVFFDRD